MGRRMADYYWGNEDRRHLKLAIQISSIRVCVCKCVTSRLLNSKVDNWRNIFSISTESRKRWGAGHFIMSANEVRHLPFVFFDFFFFFSRCFRWCLFSVFAVVIKSSSFPFLLFFFFSVSNNTRPGRKGNMQMLYWFFSAIHTRRSQGV